jgi:hypothetical protein
VDLLHRQQGPGFVRLGHNSIIALEVPTDVPILNLPTPALRFGARTRSSKDNRFRHEGMNGLDPDERLFSNCCPARYVFLTIRELSIASLIALPRVSPSKANSHS